jgi:hypothetical protein
MTDPEGTPEDVMAEVVRLRGACRRLGKIVVSQQRSMEAARIEMAQNGPEKAMQWILNSLPDVYDGPAWDGRETAAEWLDRADAGDVAGGVS